MAFKPSFEVGAVVAKAVMTEAFKIGNMSITTRIFAGIAGSVGTVIQSSVFLWN